MRVVAGGVKMAIQPRNTRIAAIVVEILSVKVLGRIELGFCFVSERKLGSKEVRYRGRF